MPLPHFRGIWVDQLERIAQSCAEWRSGADASMIVFLANLEAVTEKFESGEGGKFGRSDLPYTILIAYLTAWLSHATPGKKKGKKGIAESIAFAIADAHIAQHHGWGEDSCQEIVPYGGNWLSREFLKSLAISEMVEAVEANQEDS